MTTIPALRACERRALAPEVELGVGETTGFAGLQTCGLVHNCVRCASKILAARAGYAQAAAEAWVAAGWQVVFSTHTLRHYRRMSYVELRELLHTAWRKAYGAKSGKMWNGPRKRHGVVSYVRSYEDTWGEGSGWHLHFHVMWLLRGCEDLDAFAALLKHRWDVGIEWGHGYAVNRDYGVRVDVVDVGEAGRVGRYLFKDGDRVGVGRLGDELARSDLKDGRKAGRYGPFQLYDLAYEAGPGSAPWEAVREREAGVKGVRKMYVPKAGREALAELGVVDDRKDGTIAATVPPREVLVLIPAHTWYRHLLPYEWRIQAMKTAAIVGRDAVRELVESWGLSWRLHFREPSYVQAELEVE